MPNKYAIAASYLALAYGQLAARGDVEAAVATLATGLDKLGLKPALLVVHKVLGELLGEEG